MLVGAVSSQVKGVVSVVGSGLSWPAWEVWTAPSWTFADAGVGYVPWANVPPVRRTYSDGGVEVTLREVWTETLRQAPAAAIEGAAIQVERIGGPVLLIGAQDDQVWPSCPLSDIAWGWLVDAGHVGRFPRTLGQSPPTAPGRALPAAPHGGRSALRPRRNR